MAFNRELYKQFLGQRTKESFDQGDYESSIKYFKAELDLTLWPWKVTKDKPHIMDIIPFIAGNNFPLPIDKRSFVREGEPAYVMRLWAHKIGPNNELVICPTKSYNKKCPACEDIDRHDRNDESYANFISRVIAKQRCVYNIVSYGSREEEDQIQILEASYSYTEKNFKVLAQDPRTGELIAFSDPDIGKSISFHIGNDNYKKPFGFKLLDRSYTVKDEILKKAHILDQAIVLLSYEEIHELYTLTPKTTVQDNNSSDNPNNYPGSTSQTTAETSRKCPSKTGIIGVNIDQISDCQECTIYEDCAEEANKIDELKRKERETRQSLRRRN